MAVIATTHAGPIEARFISFPIAVLATWMCSRDWVFATTAKPTIFEVIRYFCVQGIGMICNFLLYTALVLYGGFEASPLSALAIAAAFAAFLNFVGARYFAFGTPPSSSAGSSAIRSGNQTSK